MHFLPEACTLDTPVVLIRVPFVCVLSSSSHFLLGNCIGHRQGVEGGFLWCESQEGQCFRNIFHMIHSCSTPCAQPVDTMVNTPVQEQTKKDIFTCNVSPWQERFWKIAALSNPVPHLK